MPFTHFLTPAQRGYVLALLDDGRDNLLGEVQNKLSLEAQFVCPVYVFSVFLQCLHDCTAVHVVCVYKGCCLYIDKGSIKQLRTTTAVTTAYLARDHIVSTWLCGSDLR
jgi:hypothetical protein